VEAPAGIMYWPIGTPRIYATSSGRNPSLNLFVSDDGLEQFGGSSPSSSLGREGQFRAEAPEGPNDVDIQPPPTPVTPAAPAVQSILDDDFIASTQGASNSTNPDEETAVPLKDPVLALAVARTGHLFGTITATSITLWQTKVRWEPLDLPWVCR
jgi:hypothetical protein